MNTGIFPQSAWIDLWDRAYYSREIGELERTLAYLNTVCDDRYEWDRRRKHLVAAELEEYRPILAELRTKLKPYMQRRYMRGGKWGQP